MKDGDFELQYIGSTGNFSTGHIFKGGWKAKSAEEVCWYLVTDKGEKTVEQCFYVRLDSSRLVHAESQYSYLPVYVFTSNEQGSKYKYWNRIQPGRLFLDPAIISELQSDVEKMKKIQTEVGTKDYAIQEFRGNLSSLNPDIHSYYESFIQDPKVTLLESFYGIFF